MSAPAERIPERLFVGDEGYDPDFGRRLLITLDGIEQQAVIGFDFGGTPDVGVVTRYKIGDDGSYVIDDVRECLVVEHVQGDLVVTLLPR